MTNIIKAYQDAYEETVKKLKSNGHVISIVVYGSIVSGDIWEKSDIDFLVITDEADKMESIYSKVLDVSIHINYISKNVFIHSYRNLLKGGTFHKAFFTGKLVYCSDKSIEEIYQSTRFYKDTDMEYRNIEILCNLLNGIHYTKKYMSTGRIETSYQWCISIVVNYARLLMSMDGHITDKDILSFAVGMNNEIRHMYNVLIQDENMKTKIQNILEVAEEFIYSNCEKISKPIIKLLSKEQKKFSVQDIKNINEFKQVDADLSFLLEKLSELNLIQESTRKYTSYGDEYLIDEVVYSSKLGGF